MKFPFYDAPNTATIRTITEDRRMRTLEGIRYLINLDSAEIQQNFAGGVAPPDKVESEVDTT